MADCGDNAEENVTVDENLSIRLVAKKHKQKHSKNKAG